MKPILLLLFAATAACVGALLPLISRARSKRLLLNAVRRASSDAPDGIGISVLCSGVTDAAQIENLLSPEYSRYEVIVVLDAAASVATYDYLLPVRAGCFLLPGSVERLVAELGEGRPGSLDLIRSPLGEPAALLSREAVVAAGGFGMRPLRGIPRCRRRMLWEPLLAAPRSGVRMPGRLRGLAVASLAAAFAAAAAAGWWTSAAALATLALVWAGRECAARLAGGTAFSAPGGLTAWRRLFGHY